MLSDAETTYNNLCTDSMPINSKQPKLQVHPGRYVAIRVHPSSDQQLLAKWLLHSTTPGSKCYLSHLSGICDTTTLSRNHEREATTQMWLSAKTVDKTA